MLKLFLNRYGKMLTPSSKFTIIGSILLCVLCTWYGYQQGSKHIQTLWDQDKLKQAQYINRLQQNYLNKESVYITELNNIKDIYAKAKDEYTKKLDAIKSSYSMQLQQSEQRASIYKREALSTDGCTNLAEYAGRLDRSLTEGRDVVKQLRELIKLRDAQIQQIGNTYKAEHTLME